MGCSNHKPQQIPLNGSIQFSIQLRLIRQMSPGYILLNPQTHTMYFLRQFITSEKQQHQQLRVLLSKYSVMLENCADITQIMKVKAEDNHSMCNRFYRNSVLFQFSGLTLEHQILERKRFRKYFDISQIWNIIKTAVDCLSFITKVNIFDGQNNHLKHYYQIPTITTQHFLIMPDNTIRLMDPLMLNNQQKQVTYSQVYYSPEKIGDISFIEDDKSAVFQLGMCVIHAALLDNCLDIYYEDIVKEDKIIQKIQQIRTYYLDNVLCQVLKKMTEVRRCKRPRIDDLIDHFNRILIHPKQIESTQQHIKITQVEIDILNNHNSNKQLQNIQSLAIINQNKNNLSLSINTSHFPNDLSQSYQYNQHPIITSYQTKDTPLTLNTTLNQINQTTNPGEFDDESIYTDPTILEIIRQHTYKKPVIRLNKSLNKNYQANIKIYQAPSEQERTNTQLSFKNSRIFKNIQLSKQSRGKKGSLNKESLKKGSLKKAQKPYFLKVQEQKSLKKTKIMNQLKL